MVSDFSVGQFKHLKVLLSFHGRESLRKNSYLVIYILCSNLLLFCATLIVNIKSGLSHQTIFDN